MIDELDWDDELDGYDDSVPSNPPEPVSEEATPKHMRLVDVDPHYANDRKYLVTYEASGLVTLKDITPPPDSQPLPKVTPKYGSYAIGSTDWQHASTTVKINPGSNFAKKLVKKAWQAGG